MACTGPSRSSEASEAEGKATEGLASEGRAAANPRKPAMRAAWPLSKTTLAGAVKMAAVVHEKAEIEEAAADDGEPVSSSDAGAADAGAPAADAGAADADAGADAGATALEEEDPPEEPGEPLYVYAGECEGVHVYIVTVSVDDPSQSTASISTAASGDGSYRRVGDFIGDYEVKAIRDDWTGLAPKVWLAHDGELCYAPLTGSEQREKAAAQRALQRKRKRSKKKRRRKRRRRRRRR